MKSLTEYIKINENGITPEMKANVKFIIWDEFGNKLDYSDDPKYQKIEYKFVDKIKNIEIDFLLGKTEKTWKLWVGKIGAVHYSDRPYKDLKKSNFKDALLKAIDIVVDFIDKVKKDNYNYIQYYVNF